MKKLSTFFTFLLLLFATGTMADDATWEFVWNTSRSNGGEGFYNISDHSQTTQVQKLNKLEWTFSSNSYATGYTATSGQYFGSAANPVISGTLSTAYLKGKIKSVILETKTKDAAQEVNLSVTVGGVSYGTQSPTPDKAKYTYLPTGDAAEGEIVIGMEQHSETKGIIYFYSMSITYEGEGVTQPDVVRVSPELSFGTKEITVLAGEGPITNPLTNPYKVSPITYTSSDESIAVVSKTSGAVYTMGAVGACTITASFAGNDTYLEETASYTLNVDPKPVIAAPEVDVKGGTFTEPVTVTITSDDPNALAIWYSTTLASVDDMGYDNQTIIVPGKKAQVTIDKSCTLLAVAVGNDNIGTPVSYDFVMNILIQANFAAQESSIPYYTMGWDSLDEANTWTYFNTNSSKTWTLTPGNTVAGVEPFTIIDPASEYSLGIKYGSNQYERAVSPEMEVRPNSTVEFYACFAGIWLYYGSWSFYVNDVDAGTRDLLIDAFNWAQEVGYDGPNWEKFSFGLDKYAGHKCTFEFVYEGDNGEDVAIDGFKLVQTDNSADAKVAVMQGEKVHFTDLSLGYPETYEWTFEGGEPSTSNEQNPVVTYKMAGVYSVTLTVRKGEETNTMTRSNFVNVMVDAPAAHIGMPDMAYLSPWAYAFVPTNVPVTFKDESTGQPDSWSWTFEGTDKATCNEQNPTVTYLAEGTYGLTLDVANAAGTSHDFLVDAIKAGGANDIWNITPSESQNLSGVGLGWYGYYAGSNALGLSMFAEKFGKPAASAYVDNITAYFNTVDSEDPDAVVTFQICAADENGAPGAVLASKSLKASELQCDESVIVPTEFWLDSPVKVTGDFFIVMSEFPNAYSDGVSVLCAYRGGKNKNTAWHYALDEDGYEYLETGKWVENVDDPLSIAVTAHLGFGEKPTAIEAVDGAAEGENSALYDMNGIRIGERTRPHGIFIERNGNKVRKVLR